MRLLSAVERTSLALCVKESLRNVLIFLETLLALHLVSRLKHSLKDTANPICNQLLASLYMQSSTQALAPEKERIFGGRGNLSLLSYKRIDKMDLIFKRFSALIGEVFG